MTDPFDSLGLQQGTKLGPPVQDGQAWHEAQPTRIGWGITPGQQQQQQQQQSNRSSGTMFQGGGGGSGSGSVPFQYSAGSAMMNNRNISVNTGGLSQEKPHRHYSQIDATAITAAAPSGASPGGVYPPTGGFSGVSPSLQPSQPRHTLGLPAAANIIPRSTTSMALPVSSPTPAMAVPPAKQTALSTPLEWQGNNGSGSSNSNHVLTGWGGGAQWTPPADQLGVYESMFSSASEGSAVPGTVSGRAAVQFFSRSGLPKDILKSIWSLCDPALTGCIRRPGFFAAMRLIALVQASKRAAAGGGGAAAAGSGAIPSEPVSLAGLEATRHLPLPQPHMDGFVPNAAASADAVVPRSPTFVSTAPVSVTAAAATVSPTEGAFPGGFMSNPYNRQTSAAKMVNTTDELSVNRGAWSAPPPAQPPICMLVGSPPLPTTATSFQVPAKVLPNLVASSNGAGETTGTGGAANGFSLEPGGGGSRGDVSSSSVPQVALEDQDDEDDFGDFTAAEDSTLAAPPQTQPGAQDSMEIAPASAVVASNTEEVDDDEMGDFEGAPASEASVGGVGSEQVSRSPTSIPSGMSVAGMGNGVTAGVNDAGISWMASNGEGNVGMSTTAGSGRVSGLDEMIEKNFAIAAEAPSKPMLLASMQSTPPLLGDPRAPVMVESIPARSKLAVFDAMADFDLAAEQEEWNDFADESTAPPLPPSPPPPQQTVAEVEAACPAATSAEHFPSLTLDTPQPGVIISEGEAGTVVGRKSTDATAESGKHDPVFPQSASADIVVGSKSPTPPRWLSEGLEPDLSVVAGGATTAPADTVVGSAAAVAAAFVPPHPADNGSCHDEDWGDFAEAEGVNAVLESSPTSGVAAGHGGVHGLNSSGMVQNLEESGDQAGNTPAVDVSVDDGSGEVPTPVQVLSEEPCADAGAAAPPDASKIVDPFADISPARPPPPGQAPMPPLRGPGDEEPTVFGETRMKSKDSDNLNGPAENGVLNPLSAGAVGGGIPGDSGAGDSMLPISLRDLRDGLAVRGRLEEAWEVQKRMERPLAERRRRMSDEANRGTTESTQAATANEVGGDDVGEAAGDKGKDVEEREREEERDLERWRAAMQLPPAFTLESLAATQFGPETQRAERFRGEHITGHPPVEEQAIAAGGGAAALAKALRRQRAAHRAAHLSGILGMTAANRRDNCAEGGDVAGKEAPADVLELDFGLGAKGNEKPPPTLSDWAEMVSFVTRMAEAGLAALERRHSADANTNVVGESEGGIRLEVSNGEQVGGTDSGFASVAPMTKSLASAVAGNVPSEVAHSAEFESFARGLREGVRVCRLLQAAAKDALETIEGFVSMDVTWREFVLRAREERAAAANGTTTTRKGTTAREEPTSSVGLATVGGGGPWKATEKTKSREYLHSLIDGKAGSGGSGGRFGADDVGSDEWASAIPTVEAIQNAASETPAGSAMCAVCFQPLKAFRGEGAAGAAAPSLEVIEYCGVRYFAGPVNLWVNIVGKPPPGVASAPKFD